MSEFTRMWNGDLPLYTAFWTWAVIVGLLVNIVSSVLFLVLVVGEWLVAALIVGYAFSVPYNIFVIVGVWRSADRYDGDRLWANLAKLTTIIGTIFLSVT